MKRREVVLTTLLYLNLSMNESIDQSIHWFIGSDINRFWLHHRSNIDRFSGDANVSMIHDNIYHSIQMNSS